MGDAMQEIEKDTIELFRETDSPFGDCLDYRGKQVLKNLLRQDPDNALKLQKAHEILKNDVKYASSMYQAATCLKKGKIEVFVSYDMEADTEAAKLIAKTFRELSDEKVTVTLADEFTLQSVGQDFMLVTEEAIKRAQWFITLLSQIDDPTKWCMMETGMFIANMTSNKINRLICIYHPTLSPPLEINKYHAVRADITDLVRLFDGLFRRFHPLPGWDPINPDLSDDTLLSAATNIAKAFRSPRKPIYYNYHLTLEVNKPEKLKSWRDLNYCAIETDSKTADLFGKIEPPETWGDLIFNVVKNNNTNKWLEELFGVMCKACKGDKFGIISGTFECSHGGRVMRPVLYKMERDDIKVEYKFHFFFLDEICSAPTHNISPKTLVLLTAIRMNNRFRWEIIERFKDAEWTKFEIDSCVKAFSRIEREVQSFGKWDIDLLASNYSVEIQNEIKLIGNRWQKLQSFSDGELDIAFKQHDVPKIKKIFEEFVNLNNLFFKLTFPIFEDVTIRERKVTQ